MRLNDVPPHYISYETLPLCSSEQDSSFENLCLMPGFKPVSCLTCRALPTSRSGPSGSWRRTDLWSRWRGPGRPWRRSELLGETSCLGGESPATAHLAACRHLNPVLLVERNLGILRCGGEGREVVVLKVFVLSDTDLNRSLTVNSF